MSLSDMDDVLKEFLVESYENLDQLDADFVALEQDPTHRDTLAAVFRTIHTIKGTAGFLAFENLERVTHVGENLLSKLRDGELTLTPEITTALLGMVDAVREMLGNIEETSTDGDAEYAELVTELTRLNADQPAAPVPAAEASPEPAASALPAAEPEPVAEVTPTDEPAPSSAPSSSLVMFHQNKPKPQAEPAATAGGPASSLVMFNQNKPAASTAGTSSSAPAREASVPDAPTPPPPVKPAAAEPAPVKPTKAGGPGMSEASIRVDVGLLDKLMNQVGELVLARNQVLQYASDTSEPELLATSQRLNLITTELQEGVMKTRMQPIGNVWGKFPRVVRDLAVMCGKQVRVEMEGKETELDRTIIEAIKDPLTHIVRNSVDHGIEKPEVRVENSKPAEGVLRLNAFHEGGQVNIEIVDDGGGINPAKMREKGLSKGLITPDQASTMTDRELIHLIFRPGFSTAEAVTKVSGRGVGMDVVRTNIEKIGGSLDISSEVGRGTTLKIKIPLTLAIIPALMVTSGGERFAIPQVSLLELVRLDGEQARTAIERIHGTPVYRLRGTLLPLVYLNQLLRLPEDKESTSINMVVLRADDRQFGMIVDTINDTQEIVVKPLDKTLKDIPVFAGATILGDGSVSLILDVLGVAQQGKVVSEVGDKRLVVAKPPAEEEALERHTLLLVTVGEQGRFAIPLGLVNRLEEFDASRVENSGDRLVVQYRGRIMPLISLAHAVGGGYGAPIEAEQDVVQIIVYSRDEQCIGLIVDQIDDIVDERIRIEKRSGRPGVGGAAVIHGTVTDILDLETVIRCVDPGLLDTAPMEL
ncbi:MAG: chemotaxis protein CheW [Planctomycetota bacterium]